MPSGRSLEPRSMKRQPNGSRDVASIRRATSTASAIWGRSSPSISVSNARSVEPSCAVRSSWGSVIHHVPGSRMLPRSYYTPNGDPSNTHPRRRSAPDPRHPRQLLAPWAHRKPPRITNRAEAVAAPVHVSCCPPAGRPARDVRPPRTSGFPRAWLTGYGVIMWTREDAGGPGALGRVRAAWRVALGGLWLAVRALAARAGLTLADRPDRVRCRHGRGGGHVPAGGRRVPAAGPARSDLAVQ